MGSWCVPSIRLHGVERDIRRMTFYRLLYDLIS
jgi:hypothetical protein